MNFELEKSMKILKGCENCYHKKNCPLTIKDSIYCSKTGASLIYPEEKLIFIADNFRDSFFTVQLN
jgi:hypothetical protein